MNGRVVDLCAGPGGWDIAARALGISTLGIEHDGDACATRAAAGLPTVRADITRPPFDLDALDLAGLIASPPCTAFSRMGRRRGLHDLPLLTDALARIAAGDYGAAHRGYEWADPTTPLVTEPLRWAILCRPRWVALEQVDTVLPVWRLIGGYLERLGYDVWTATVNAADYGVPQTRRRAVLLARKGGVVAPSPTHAKAPGMFELPWVTMADALGWDESDVLATNRDQRADGSRQTRPAPAPAPALTGKAIGQWKRRPGLGAGTVHADRSTRKPWAYTRPATPIASRLLVADPGANANRHNGATKSRNDGIPVTISEALILQSFPADYPLVGTKTSQSQQIGNAIPPGLATALLGALTKGDPR